MTDLLVDVAPWWRPGMRVESLRLVLSEWECLRRRPLEPVVVRLVAMADPRLVGDGWDANGSVPA